MHNANSGELSSENELPDEMSIYPFESVRYFDATFPHGVRQLHSSDAHHALSNDVQRKIYLDLSPRTLLAAGAMVELMAANKVGHYVDFRPLEATYVTFMDYGLRYVPASRSDVFQNCFVTMLEKRLLMRYVKSVMAIPSVPIPSSSDEEAGGISFGEEMRLASLTDKLKTFINYGIALSTTDAADRTASEAREAIALYQRSLMCFGTRTPFLYTNYGSSELPQAFCRLSAVHGSTYVLRCGISGVITKPVSHTQDTQQIVRIITSDGEHVACKALVSTSSSLPSACIVDNSDDVHTGHLWRAICVLDSSIVVSSHQRLLVFVPKGTLGNETAGVRLRQLDSSVGVCPKGYFVLYAETVGIEGSESDVTNVLKSYVAFNNSGNEVRDHETSQAERCGVPECVKSNSNELKSDLSELPPSEDALLKPKVLWGAVYSKTVHKYPKLRSSMFSGLHLLAEGGAEADAEFCLKTSRMAFKTMMPEASFFVREEEQNEANLDKDNNRSVEPHGNARAAVDSTDSET